MSYDFSFDKKSVLFIAAGSLAIGILLFLAGFIIGWDRGEYAARLEVGDRNGAKTAQKQPASEDRIPAVAAPQAESKAVANPKSAEEKPESAAAAPAKEEKPAPPPLAAQEEKPSPAVPPKASEQASAQASPEKTAPAQSAAADSADPAPDPSAFSLQLGAFQNEQNAVRFKNDLKLRGYPVFVFNTHDSGGHAWHTVRLGHYPDVRKASDAAAVFYGKEKLAVFVRPGNEL